MPEYFLSGESKGEYAEKGSVFTAKAYPISSLSEVKAILSNLKESFADASHFCSAYRVYHNSRLDEFATDAGEPKGSAGLPILNVLKRYELVNTCLFVLRFYGGSKLGIPGLIHAYGTAAENAISNGIRIPWIPTVNITLSFAYVLQGKVEAVLHRYNVNIISTDYGESIKFQIEVSTQNREEVVNNLTEVSTGRIEVSF